MQLQWSMATKTPRKNGFYPRKVKKVIPEIEGCRVFPEKKVKREMLA